MTSRAHLSTSCSHQARGLTMLEVLAATVLLSMLAVACLPSLTKAMASLHRPVQMTSLSDLSELADQFMDDPSAFGFKDASAIIQRQQFQIEWPDGFSRMDRPAVTIQCLLSEDSDVEHCWLVFALDGQPGMGIGMQVSRWLQLPKPRDDSAIKRGGK